jgi:transcriptional regulator with XRE-family HTH domain
MSAPVPQYLPRVIQQLVTLRRAAGISQRQMAQEIGTKQSAISDIETGLHLPNLDTLSRYAERFGMEVVLTPRSGGAS